MQNFVFHLDTSLPVSIPSEFIEKDMYWRFSRTFRFDDSLRVHRIQHVVLPSAVIYSIIEYRTKLAKGKAHGMKSKGNQAQPSGCPVPLESYRTCLIFPVISCQNTCEVLSARAAR